MLCADYAVFFRKIVKNRVICAVSGQKVVPLQHDSRETVTHQL